MSEHRNTVSILMLALVLLFALFLGTACGTAPSWSIQAARSAVSTVTPTTAVMDETLADPDVSLLAPLSADDHFECEQVTQIPIPECAALVALYNSTNGPHWTDNNDWLTTNTPCNWSGITCSAGHISAIHLLYSQLRGTLPPELGHLSQLHVLGLWVNQLQGPLPAELGRLSALTFLDLSSNQLTGSLPPELAKLTNLQTLSLAHNQLSGALPPALGNLTSLEILDLSNNQFSEAIPAELGNLPQLGRLCLAHNQFSGAIPATLGSSGRLNGLDLSYNQLSGPVPAAVAQIPQHNLWGNQLAGTFTGDGQTPLVVDYAGVHFTVDPSLAESIWAEVVPATAVLEGEPIWYAAPEHRRFTFANPPLLPGRSPMGINLGAEAQLLIYPLAELAALDPSIQTQIETLQSLLTTDSPIPAGSLPLLPVTNASQVFQVQVQQLVLDNFRGLRFITQHAQEARPVNNQELFYTFQGISGDGAYYIAAFFPVTTSVLPDAIAVEDWDAFSVNFATYLSGTIVALDQLSPAEFTPDLALLDAVIVSLRVGPDF